MTRGQVKWFDPKKGYGFIVGPEGQDVFVHYSHIDAEGFKALKNGEAVDYELVQGDKGWQARGVKGTGEVAEGAEDSGIPPAAPPPAHREPPRQRPAGPTGPTGYSSSGGGAPAPQKPPPATGGGYSGAGGPPSRGSGGYAGGYEAGPGKRQEEDEE